MSDSSLRQAIRSRLREAEETGNQKLESLMRLLGTAISVRDQSGKNGQMQEIPDALIQTMITDMIDQRIEEIDKAECAGRIEDALQETYELDVLKTFLPSSCQDEELEGEIREVIAAINATRLADIGDVMTALTDRIDGPFNLQQAKDCAVAQLRALSNG